MNYIKEINAFFVKIETNPLSASANVLWHTLMHINNQTGWLKEFSVAATVICYKSGLPNSSFKRARTELQAKGYITYTSRGRQAPLYQIHSLVAEFEENLRDTEETLDQSESYEQEEQTNFDREGKGETPVEVNRKDGGQKERHKKPCHKTDQENGEGDHLRSEHESNISAQANGENFHQDTEGGTAKDGEQIPVQTNDDGEANDSQLTVEETFEIMQEYFSRSEDGGKDQAEMEDMLSFYTYSFYVDNFGEPPKYVCDELYMWAEDMGDTLVYEALKRAVESGHLSWQYTKGILNNWQQQQLSTIEDVLTSEENYRRERSMSKSQWRKTAQPKEVIPDWFKERNKVI